MKRKPTAEERKESGGAIDPYGSSFLLALFVILFWISIWYIRYGFGDTRMQRDRLETLAKLA